jgi:hypothetical protein
MASFRESRYWNNSFTIVVTFVLLSTRLLAQESSNCSKFSCTEESGNLKVTLPSDGVFVGEVTSCDFTDCGSSASIVLSGGKLSNVDGPVFKLTDSSSAEYHVSDAVIEYSDVNAVVKSTSSSASIAFRGVEFRADGIPRFPNDLPSSLTSSSSIFDIEKIKSMTVENSVFWGNDGETGHVTRTTALHSGPDAGAIELNDVSFSNMETPVISGREYGQVSLNNVQIANCSSRSKGPAFDVGGFSFSQVALINCDVDEIISQPGHGMIANISEFVAERAGDDFVVLNATIDPLSSGEFHVFFVLSSDAMTQEDLSTNAELLNGLQDSAKALHVPMRQSQNISIGTELMLTTRQWWNNTLSSFQTFDDENDSLEAVYAYLVVMDRNGMASVASVADDTIPVSQGWALPNPGDVIPSKYANIEEYISAEIPYIYRHENYGAIWADPNTGYLVQDYYFFYINTPNFPLDERGVTLSFNFRIQSAGSNNFKRDYFMCLCASKDEKWVALAYQGYENGLRLTHSGKTEMQTVNPTTEYIWSLHVSTTESTFKITTLDGTVIREDKVGIDTSVCPEKEVYFRIRADEHVTNGAIADRYYANIRVD